MIRHCIVVSLLLQVLLLPSGAQSIRKHMNMDEGWKFSLGAHSRWKDQPLQRLLR